MKSAGNKKPTLSFFFHLLSATAAAAAASQPTYGHKRMDGQTDGWPFKLPVRFAHRFRQTAGAKEINPPKNEISNRCWLYVVVPQPKTHKHNTGKFLAGTSVYQTILKRSIIAQFASTARRRPIHVAFSRRAIPASETIKTERATHFFDPDLPARHIIAFVGVLKFFDGCMLFLL